MLIRKGFMNLDSFMDSVNSHGDLTDKAVVLHFRIATHGGVNPGCCHPFPLTNDLDSLHRRKSKAEFGVAHNGVVQGMNTSDKLGISDTIAYIMDVLAPLGSMCDLTTDVRARSIIEATAGSKFAVLKKNGRIATFGKFEESGGILYSNDTYLGWDSLKFNYGFGYGRKSLSSGGSDDNYWPLPYIDCIGCSESAGCAKYGPYCYTEEQAGITALNSAA